MIVIVGFVVFGGFLNLSYVMWRFINDWSGLKLLYIN